MAEGIEDGCVGIVGLGLVGKALAQRLLAAGYSVCGYDIDEVARNAAEALGVKVVGSPDAIGQHCGCIILSLPTSEIRHKLLFDGVAFASGWAEGTLLLDTTTGRAEDLEQDIALLAEANIDLVDVCVLGSSAQVEQGEAILLVGDTQEGADGYASLLECFSQRAFYLGAAGDGCRMKLVANQVIGLNRLVLAEALGMADKAGLDLNKTLEVLQSGPAASQVMVTKGKKMIDRDFAPQARLAQHAKDVGLILEMAEAAGAEVPLSTLHQGILRDLIDDGYGEEDNAAVIRAFRIGVN